MLDNPLIEIGLPIALAIIMVGIGLTLTTADFARERRAPRAAIVGTVAQLLGPPAAAFLIAWALSLSPAITVGLVVAAACPGGSTSNLVAYLGRANVALSIVLTVISSIAIVLTLPFWANLALEWQPITADVDVHVPIADTAGMLIGIVLVPVGVGMLVRARKPELAATLERFVGIVGAVVLVALIIAISVAVRDQILDLLAASGPSTLLLSLVSVGLAAVLGTVSGLSAEDRLTLGIELAVKNSTIGLLIALTVIGSEAVSFTTAVYGVVMYLPALALVVVGRRLSSGRPDDAGTAAA